MRTRKKAPSPSRSVLFTKTRTPAEKRAKRERTELFFGLLLFGDAPKPVAKRKRKRKG